MVGAGDLNDTRLSAGYTRMPVCTADLSREVEVHPREAGCSRIGPTVYNTEWTMIVDGRCPFGPTVTPGASAEMA